VESERAAAAYYQIPESAIKNKLKDDFNSKPGCPTLHLFEETVIVELIKTAQFGFPMTEQVFYFVTFTFSTWFKMSIKYCYLLQFSQ
jgi:hypothetical protein